MSSFSTPSGGGSPWPLELVERNAGTSFEEVSRRAIVAWLDLLLTWNAQIDLTAARTKEAMVEVMLTDAVAMAPHIQSGASVIDVGTGAGAPGLPLALLRPDLRVTLVEPMAKRTAFLRTVLGSTGRTDIVLDRCRGEDVRTRGLRFDVAMARATLPPPEWLALGTSLTTPEGSVWVLLAKEPPPEQAGWGIAETLNYVWPQTQGSRRALRYTRG